MSRLNVKNKLFTNAKFKNKIVFNLNNSKLFFKTICESLILLQNSK